MAMEDIWTSSITHTGKKKKPELLRAQQEESCGQTARGTNASKHAVTAYTGESASASLLPSSSDLALMLTSHTQRRIQQCLGLHLLSTVLHLVRLPMLYKYMLPHLDHTTFHSPEPQVLHSLNLRYFRGPCKATGRGPSKARGLNNTHGLSTPKTKTLRTVLHVDTSLCQTPQGQHKCNDGDKDSFRRTIFYPIVDTILGELNRRFSKDNCEIMRGIQALDPKSTCFLQEEVVFRLREIYERDSEDLSHELHQRRRLLQRKQQSGMPNFFCIVELAVFFEPHKDVFHELFRLCKIAIALPVSSAACERSFSALKLIKTHLRTTITDDRLSNLGVLSIESKRTKSLDMDNFLLPFTKTGEFI
ncbi:uncharacterized protein LOC123958784 [Micropterus dolomieu]|uniref:uncharacterized protein LOC123958784 n=1 Tax=Micropterus dolomieu TaxID=147949 RepID=UPI001E8D87A5|nr:uncharacterized protein LOC123958784 [Micropterus dolomieu]